MLYDSADGASTAQRIETETESFLVPKYSTEVGDCDIVFEELFVLTVSKLLLEPLFKEVLMLCPQDLTASCSALAFSPALLILLPLACFGTAFP